MDDVLLWAANLRKLIYDWTGILVTIGVAESRALAKVAVLVSNKSESHVADLRDTSSAETRKILQEMQIHDVWGVGRRLAPKLQVAGIRTAWDLAELKPDSPAMGLLNITGRQLVAELNGWSSQQEIEKAAQKSMMHTRSFGEAITAKSDIRSALGTFSDSLAAKLRRQGLVAGHISVFMRYRDQGPEKHAKTLYAERRIAPTADTFALETTVDSMINELFEPDRRYKKAGVMVGMLSSADCYQIALYDEVENLKKSEALMQAIDSVSEKTSVQIHSAATYLGTQNWRGKRQKLSPYDHASWKTIPTVR